MKKPLIEIKDVDRRFYDERLRDFLPQQVIDIHTHVWRSADMPPAARPDPRSVGWPSLVAADNPIEDLLETYRLMLPGKQVTPLIFATIGENVDLDIMNAYVAQASREQEVPALLFSRPDWSAEAFERKLHDGGFIGAKSYLSFVADYIPTPEVRILDFFPRHQLEVLNRLGMLMMLHIPRNARLKDPVNLAELLLIEREYPDIRLIVAHVGRAYCDHDVGNAFEILAGTRNMSFDFSANTNDKVFEQLIRAVGPKRILFGTDMPILRMRMRRVTRGDHYVNVVPRGMYGDVSGDKNMDEVDGAEAEQLTFFLYEEIDAFRLAAGRAGLSREDIEDVFYRNGRRMIEGARET